jgi:hypothetical protein
MKSLLDGRGVERISAYLVEGDLDESPASLTSNIGKVFAGSKIYGQGFLFDDEGAKRGETSSLEDMRSLIAKEPANSAAIFPYVGGDEINTHPTHSHHRFAIDFADLSEAEVRNRWPCLLEVVEVRVRPERQKLKDYGIDKRRKRFWWQYGSRSSQLYSKIGNLPTVIVVSLVSPHLAFAVLPARMVFSHNVGVFAYSTLSAFCAFQNGSHEMWARMFSATFEDRLNYRPTDCFVNFPFPSYFEINKDLESTGYTYHEHRAALMVARNEGMTKIYNRFHDRSETAEDIRRLRELHAAMDRAVLEAYGWHDLAARAEPIFLDETNDDDPTYQARLFWPSDFRDEVLARLLALNAERHAEEVRLGIAPGMKGKRGEDEDEVTADEE